MFKRLPHLFHQACISAFLVSMLGLLAFNAYQAYRYFVFIGRVEQALVACTFGEPLRARDHLYAAMAYAPDDEARNGLQSTGRRIRYGDCGENMVGF
jgi:hypothetical protein